MKMVLTATIGETVFKTDGTPEDLAEMLTWWSKIGKVPEQIAAAFADLRELGYAAEGPWTDCTSCGHGRFQDAGTEKYVFYHLQDAEMLLESGQVYLGWAGDADEIVKVLARRGLNPVWDGGEGTRILITVPPNS